MNYCATAAATGITDPDRGNRIRDCKMEGIDEECADDLNLPGVGMYAARVMIHGDQYAGTWRGTDHGGEMWGRIEHGAAQPQPSAVPAPAG